MSTIVKEMLRNYYNIDDSSKFDLDRAIESLARQGSFSSEDLIVIKLTVDGVHYKEIAKVIEETASNVNFRLIKVAGKIADFLGDEYKDEKILREVASRLGRPLTSEEENYCWKVIRAGHPLKKGVSIYNFKAGISESINKGIQSKTEG
jgi:hypothetical protein